MPRVRTDTEQSVASYPGARIRHNDVVTESGVHQPLMLERGASDSGTTPLKQELPGGNNGAVTFTDSPEISVDLYEVSKMRKKTIICIHMLSRLDTLFLYCITYAHYLFSITITYA